MRFRPAPVPTAFVALGLFILFNLGAWQVRRHFERNEQLAAVELKFDIQPAANGDIVAPYSDLQWRKANLRGHFHDVPSVFLAGRFEFGEPGYDLIHPFQIEGGPSILVVRGWIPSSDWRALSDTTGLSDETVTLQGLLVEPLGEDDAVLIPASDTAPLRYRRDSFAAVRATSPIETIPLVLVAGVQLQDGAFKSRETFPVTGYVPKPKSRPHVQYAMTWFLTAGTLIVIWAAAGVQRAKRLTAAQAPQSGN